MTNGIHDQEFELTPLEQAFETQASKFLSLLTVEMNDEDHRSFEVCDSTPVGGGFVYVKIGYSSDIEEVIPGTTLVVKSPISRNPDGTL